MKLAIHNSNSGFHLRWVTYCKEKAIPYQLVNCYSNDIIDQLRDCGGLMWHHSQGNPKDIIVAKQILFALEHTGFKVFPDFHTGWHFDDKVGQRYLLKAIDAPMVPTYVFFNQEEALAWAAQTTFPKVFKLRGGAGSTNVRLAKSKKGANQIIRQAFGRGFQKYNALLSLKERWRKYRLGKSDLWDIIKGIIRLVNKPQFSKIGGKEFGYVYFQDFIPNNSYDIRIIVVDGKAFALKRMVRENDFRASGSGSFKYAKEEFDEGCVKIAFDLTKRLKGQCVAFDFVFNRQNQPLVLEISYGFTPSGYDECPGYWDEGLNWQQGKFNPYGWMVDQMIKKSSNPQ